MLALYKNGLSGARLQLTQFSMVEIGRDSCTRRVLADAAIKAVF